MELIITEKENVARRIADILSDGAATTETVRGVTVYRWGGRRCIGLAGHVVEVDFPEEYEEWRDVEPAELAEAEVITRPSKPDIVAALEELAGDAETVTVATDYDREGELIGKEALDIVREANPDAPARRVRFSSISESAVGEAFDEPETLDEDLAAAGEARQVIDLAWGAALTRFLSLSAGRRGDEFISVGRVQTPTLRIIVEQEREIEAFEPEDYWEVTAGLGADEEFEADYVYDDDGRQAERIHDEAAADAVADALAEADRATVESVRRRTRDDDPPAPFDTTGFIRAAGSLGYSASRAMSLAEQLYTAGYVSYPRTDNTVYPDDLDLEERLTAFADDPEFGDDAQSLLEGPVTPTSGDSETTDHPPIHPTAERPDRNDLSADEWEIYELVVRRFFATLAEPAEWEHLRLAADAPGLETAGPGDGSLVATGKRLLDEGYHAVYPYFGTAESRLPDLEEGEQLVVAAVDRAAKQTQPPRRYGQSRLVERMEELGIGTKSTRHNTIEKLYDRGYVEDDPPRPTRLARAVVEAAEEYAEMVVSEAMTRRLEENMTDIAEGEQSLSEVTAESRDLLGEVFEELEEAREEIADHLAASLKADRTLGPCPDCGEALLVRESRGGSQFVGCDGYPDCEYTLPLPSRGDPQILDDVCEDHGLREVKMLAGRSTFVHGCPLCRAEEADEAEDRAIGACPECGAGELAIKTLQSGSRLVGCTRYPDCEYSLPLPRRGDIEVTAERCGDHDLPELVVHDGDDPWELGCPICNYREYQARERDLADIDGIGEATRERLADAGVEDVADLAAADPEAVAEAVEGVTADRLEEWQSETV